MVDFPDNWGCQVAISVAGGVVEAGVDVGDGDRLVRGQNAPLPCMVAAGGEKEARNDP